ncbi:nuclear transport factor 2 family protein [Albidovulum sp.]|jgi:hypothetical protein|uniref:nuclear transport factor 2 family protein n=1 Tax=Albidovulum sp. TaxID=1872424 RepID=UPI003070A2D5
METEVRALFDRYERVVRDALAGRIDKEETAALYAAEVIAASPAGVRSGRNDETFRQVLAQGYEHYRAIGTREMRIRALRITPIDAHHCLAHVAWRALYARDDLPETAVDFDVHYLVQVLDGAARVFGWVAGDEEAALRQHGVV